MTTAWRGQDWQQGPAGLLPHKQDAAQARGLAPSHVAFLSLKGFLWLLPQMPLLHGVVGTSASPTCLWPLQAGPGLHPRAFAFAVPSASDTFPRCLYCFLTSFWYLLKHLSFSEHILGPPYPPEKPLSSFTSLFTFPECSPCDIPYSCLFVLIADFPSPEGGRALMPNTHKCSVATHRRVRFGHRGRHRAGPE